MNRCAWPIGLLLALVVAAGAEDTAMSAPAETFADAVGAVTRAPATTVQLPPSLPYTRVLLGVVAGPEGEVALLVPVRADGQSGPPLPLGEAGAIRSARVLDLAQAATLDLTVAPPPTAGRRPRQPGLLVCLGAPDGDQERLALIALTDPPALWWSAVSRENRGPGGGFATLTLTLKPRAQRPDLTLLQHALPTPGAADFLPGPPLTVTYRWRGGQWQREP